MELNGRTLCILFVIYISLFVIGIYNIRKELPTFLFSKDFYDSDRNHIIFNRKCRIPDIDPWNPVAQSAFENKSNIYCGHQLPLVKIEKDGGHIYVLIDERVKALYKVISCEYCAIKRISSSSPDKSFDIADCQRFNDILEARSSIFYVICQDAVGNLIYKDIFGTFRPADVKEKLLKADALNKPYNVLIVGIDSISRLNLIRVLPKTHGYLKKTDWIEFLAYNKVGENTFPNLMAVLTGDSIAQLMKKNLSETSLDDEDFIWKDYNKFGYITAFAEDASHISTFNLHKKGFYHKPTDFYFRPYTIAYETHLAQWVDGMLFCAGSKTVAERIMNLASDFCLTFYNTPYFGMFWMNSFSHDNMNTPGRVDQYIRDFFQTLEDNEVMKNAIIIFLADHGMRLNNIRYSLTGWYEDRLPFLYVWLPYSFRRQRNQQYKNMRENSKKLTSAYDLYMTLQEILTLSNLNHQPKASKECPTCASFFRQMPNIRSCEEAGIPMQWCTCTGYNKLHRQGFLATAAAGFVLESVRKIVVSFGSYRKCATLELKEVEHARISDNRGDWYKNITYVSVVFKTKPLTVFEGTLQLVIEENAPIFSMIGDPNRIDGYENTGKCVQNPMLKKFCYC